MLLEYPFRGRWRAVNSPARRVPSHGTHLLGTTYAIDFVAVDERGRSARRGLRSAFATEPPERFTGFGADILAPVAGVVVIAHDGEADHGARRSPLTLLPYALGQAARLRAGPAAVAGNHVVIAVAPQGPFVLLAHLRRGSIRVTEGQRVVAGDLLGACGNSGNSTEPHVHIQATDSIGWDAARGLPIAFRGPRGAALPAEGSIVAVG